MPRIPVPLWLLCAFLFKNVPEIYWRSCCSERCSGVFDKPLEKLRYSWRKAPARSAGERAGGATRLGGKVTGCPAAFGSQHGINPAWLLRGRGEPMHLPGR